MTDVVRQSNDWTQLAMDVTVAVSTVGVFALVFASAVVSDQTLGKFALMLLGYMALSYGSVRAIRWRRPTA